MTSQATEVHDTSPRPLDEQGYQRAFQQFLNLFIEPEIKRRQAEGRMPSPATLRTAQVLFFADGRPPLVRLNEEVQVAANVRLRGGKPELGAHVSVDDIEHIEAVRPAPIDDFGDCGHFTAMAIQGRWAITFDFRYNKRLATRHLEVAEQFLASAGRELRQRSTAFAVAPFVDTLFSAAELGARAHLLGIPDLDFTRKGTHKSIQIRFNKWTNIGNARAPHRDVLNALSGLRDRVRYLRSPVTLDKREARKMLRTVEDLIADARRWIG